MDLFYLIFSKTLYSYDHFLSNYADDNILYNTGKDLQLVKSLLVNDFRTVPEWFYDT